jgi:hypothetical protein
MSLDSGFFVKIATPLADRMSVLRFLLDAGWELNDHGNIVFLPLGDDGAFSWQATPLASEDEVWGLLETKCQRRETIGVVLSFRDAGSGGEFLLEPDGTVIFTPSINRRTVAACTDVTWYLERLLPALGKCGVIESWEWREHV